jgi:glycosyltransferase involved in cell wall biosynthesis
MKICALIPVYNNKDTIAEVVKRCRAVIEPDVLAVSDGSTDGSDKEAARAGAKVFRLKKNQGKGAAVVFGLKRAQDLGYTHAIILDADGQHLPEEIPRLLNAVWEYPERLWVCVRKMIPSAVPAASRRGRSISNFWTTVNGWQRCKDAQSGFRCYPIKKILALPCKEKGFAFEMEVLVRASWADMRIGHVEVDVIYPRKGEKRITHFDPKRDNIRAARLSFLMFWGMLARLPCLFYKKIIKRRSSSSDDMKPRATSL